jgi:integrase
MKPKAKGATKAKDRTVHPGVYERGLGTANPYFQVRIRHRGEAHQTQRFPYLPAAHLQGKTKSTTLHQGMKREAALANAIKASSDDKAFFHFYGKPRAQVPSEYVLRDWIQDWVKEACDRVDATTGQPLEHMTERKGGEEDGKQILRVIRTADAYATTHKRASVMDKRVTDLVKDDFAGRHGLLKQLTGRAKKGEKKPPASAATQRRALALLGAVWNHARDNWDMDLPRPWLGAKIQSTEKKTTTRALSLEEMEKVEAALASVARSTLAAIYFLRWTAARAGEMHKLRWENISWPASSNSLKRPMVKFVGTKTPRQGAYRERDVPLVPGAIAALQMLYDKNKGPPKEGIVFPAPQDPKRALSRDTAYQAWVRAIRRAGVPHARLHDLRHTRTTELSADIPKAQAMVITGHSDDRTFNRYTHLEETSVDQIEKGDQRRRKGRDQDPAVVPAQKKSILDMLANLELTPEERMAAIAALAAK